MLNNINFIISLNINFIISLNIRMNKEERNEGQDINNKETKKLRTLILSTNVNDYDTGEQDIIKCSTMKYLSFAISIMV